MAGHVERMGTRRNAYRKAGRKEGRKEGRRPLGRPRRRWVDNIKMLREIGWEGIDWIDLA
jgi:hypothetical protein